MYLSLLLGVTYVFVSSTYSKKNVGLTNLNGLLLFWLLYGFYAVNTLFFSGGEVLVFRLLYRLIEWTTILFSIQLIFRGPKEYVDKYYLKFMLSLPFMALLLISVAFVYNPSLIIFQSTGQLGGIAIHPNNLCLCFGLGSFHWFHFAKHRLRKIISFLFIVLALFTISRSGLISLFIAYFCWNIYYL